MLKQDYSAVLAQAGIAKLKQILKKEDKINPKDFIQYLRIKRVKTEVVIMLSEKTL